MNDHLRIRTFFSGNKISIADISISSALYYGYKFILDVNFRYLYANVTRWFNFITDQI